MGDESERGTDEVIAMMDALHAVGWSFEEIAIGVGLTTQTIYAYRRDMYVPPNIAIKIAQLYRNNVTAIICKYNMQVDCEDQTKCESCGWNPAEAERRRNEWKKQQYALSRLQKSAIFRKEISRLLSRII